MFAFAVCALLLIAAAGSFMVSFPIFHARSRVFASSRTVTVPLTVKTAQRVRDIRVHRDPHITGRDVFGRLRRSKRQYHRVGATFAVSITDVNNHGSGYSLWTQFTHDLLDAAAGDVPGTDNSSADIQLSVGAGIN